MKDLFVRIAFFVILFLIIPLLFIRLFPKEKSENNSLVMINVYDVNKNKIHTLCLEEYILKVVAAEMPANFHVEALKAQAVCARTYALRKVNAGLSEHKGADICTDFAHCQAWCDYDEMKNKWGKNYKNNLKKIKKSVDETAGEVIIYNDEYAISVFHSCSNGKTENSSDVWGGKYPYLVSVKSEGDFEKNDYHTTFSLSKDEFVAKISSENPNSFTYDGDLYIGDFIMTEGDNVHSLKIGNQTFTGKKIRELFSLKSTSFTISEENDSIVFDVYGNGHGVGLSQYGANGMAKKGSRYDEILKHYYRGIELCKMNNPA